MDNYDIGGFATWEENLNGEAVIRYKSDSVKRLSFRQLDIVNVIIENSINYDTYITANSIADTLFKKGKKDHDKDTVKHALKKIREDKHWDSVIEATHNGYLIKCSKIPSEIQDITNVANSKPVSDSTTEPVSSSNGKPNEILNRRIELYISNFIRDNEQIRTYYYDSSLRDVSEVMFPVTLMNRDDNSAFEMNFEKLYESDSRYRYLVSGIVGSGKSLLARKLALDAAIHYAEYGILPIIYKLENFKDNEMSLFEILNQEYESYIPDDVPRSTQALVHAIVPPSEFSEHCQRGSVLLLLDGLDAIQPDDKEVFEQKLKAFLRSYGKNTVVIFSRPIGRFTEYDTFNVLTIKELTSKQVSKLIDMFIDPAATDTSCFKANVLERNKLSLYSSTLFSNPLFISMLTSEYGGFFFFEKPAINEAIEKLVKYVTCEDQFLRFQRYSKTRMSLWELNRELCSFCYYLVYNNCATFDAGDVMKYQEYDYGDSYNAHDFLDDLCRTYGLTMFVNGKYKFIDGLIVEYYYAKHLISRGNGIYGVWDTLSDCYSYSAYNIVSLMYEMDSKTIRDYVILPYMESIYDKKDEESYVRFLINNFSTLSYYVGEGSYEVNNERLKELDTLIVKTFEIEQDINHLKLPPIEGGRIRPVFDIDEATAKEIGCRKGLISGWPSINEKCEELNLKPVGYVYQIKVRSILDGNDKDYSEIKEILLSDTFPLRVEFNKMVDLYNKLAQN